MNIASPKAGLTNSISDVDGICVGQAHCASARTGVTLILPQKRVVAACNVAGGGPGTRETDALNPENLVDEIDAVALAGGSVYGLAAASELTKLMGQEGRGFSTGAALPSPIIPAAILFDLANSGDKADITNNLYETLAAKAYQTHGKDIALGNAGAGYGAIAGALKGGVGSASAMLDGFPAVAALMIANPVGAMVDPQGHFWAQDQALMIDGVTEYGDITKPPSATHMPIFAGSKMSGQFTGGNTSIGVVATSADLSVAEAKRVAIMAQDGLAQAVRPAHTPFDGDTIFVLATGDISLAHKSETRPLNLAILGSLAASCVARSMARAVWHASDIDEIKSYHSVWNKH